jgi:hypothetical protein
VNKKREEMINLKVLLGALVVWACSYSYSSANDLIDPTDENVVEHTIQDDSAVSVELEFGFPFYGTTYYHSWMHSNGVVSLVGINQGPPSSFCCNGQNLETSNISISNFIAPLWTDLIQKDKDGGFYTQAVDSDGDGVPDSMRYMWDRIEEFYNENENTFGVELFESGKIDMHHQTVNITNHSVTIGIVGDHSIGQYEQVTFGQNGLQIGNYQNSYSDIPNFDMSAICSANPLYSPDCPGYADAYALYLFQQQCSANPLYDSQCPGYADAYYNQQCSIDPLYDTGCTGYAEAYYTQQCTLDPLYDSGCNGYAAAYLDQQCTLDQLYDTQCPLYEQTYYETYVLPGLNEQIEEASGTNTDVVTTTTTQTGAVEVTATGVRDPVESATNVSTTGDSTVDEILRNNNDTTDTVVVDITPVESPTVETTETITQTETREEREEPEQEITVASLEREIEDEREDESSSNVDEPVEDDREEENSDTESERVETDNEGSSDDESSGGDKPKESSGDADRKSDKKTTKEKIKKMVAEKAKNLATDMANAASFEQQQEIQAQVLALMGFNSDFTAYNGIIIPQTVVYQQEQMPDATIPNSRRGLRNGLAQQILHEKMVDMQYK